MLNKAGNFLIEVVTEPVGREIKEQLLMINRRWEDAGTEARHFVQYESVEKTRREYQAIVDATEAWLVAVEQLAGSRDLPCEHAEVKTHVHQLDVSVHWEPPL